MSPSWKRALTALVLVVALVVAGLLAAAWSMLPLDGTALVLDGERFSLADLHGTRAALFSAVVVAVVVAVVSAAIVAGVVGLGVGLLSLAFGGVVVVGTLAIVALPFALAAWLVWRLVRARPAPLVVRP